MNRTADIVIIGGGPAGLAAAWAACQAGIESKRILLIERDEELGGILNQCIHNGFGLHTFKEELTGPEYAARYIERVEEAQIPYLLRTIVVDIQMGCAKESRKETDCGGQTALSSEVQSSIEQADSCKYVTAMNKEEGLFTIEAKAVILAMGCRERSRGALNIPGYRPAGIYSAGTAQRYVNIEGRMPGKEVVILGSGDIGLIMARRMTLEGAKVRLVAELMPYSGGLKRNIVQCLEDYDIPLKLSHTVIDIDGKERVKGVTVARVDENRKPVPGTEEYIRCDTLLLSCGLIPENELSLALGVELNPVTSGPVVNESLETNREGVFACGNVLHVHDLVDYVSEEAEQAGRNAALYIKQREITEDKGDGENRESGENGNRRDEQEAAKDRKQAAGIDIRPGNGVRYTVPSLVRLASMQPLQTVRFRVGNVYKDVTLVVYFNDTPVIKLKKKVMTPGEMEQVKLQKEKLQEFAGLKEIRIEIEI